MNNPRNNPPAGGQNTRERRALPFFIEFVKFATGFAAIISVALFTLHAASAAMN